MENQEKNKLASGANENNNKNEKESKETRLKALATVAATMAMFMELPTEVQAGANSGGSGSCGGCHGGCYDNCNSNCSNACGQQNNCWSCSGCTGCSGTCHTACANDCENTCTSCSGQCNDNLGHTIYFDRAGGSGGSNTLGVITGQPMGASGVPGRNYYTFNGYYDGSGAQYFNSNGSPVRNYPLYSDVTLYARWTPVNYSITYDLQGGQYGSGSYPTSYNIETPNIVVNDPSKAGHTFKNWTVQNN